MRRLGILALVLAAAATQRARGATWEGVPSSGRILVHVFKTGLFSGFAHDHHFEVTEWRATAEVPDGDLTGTSVGVVLMARSLRDRQKALSDADRRKVDAQAAGPDVLDAEHHPQVEYRSDGVTFEPATGNDAKRALGTVHGRLTLHGHTQPLDVAFEADRDADTLRVRGRARVKQSEFGIKPFRGFGGTVGVKDELEIEIEMTLRPAPARAPTAG